MAKDIQSIERNVATPTSSVSGGNAFERLGDAAQGLADTVANKITDAGIDFAGKQGAADAASGEAPKTLAPGVNKVTRAYNTAVADTEARHLVISAREQIREAYANATDPANFNEQTPAIFKSTLEGITEGTLQHTRPDNRGKVQVALEQITGDASIDMLNHSIAYDNKKTMSEMTNEVDYLVKARRDAAIQGSVGNVAAIDEILDETLNDYATRNATIKTMLPDLRKKLDQNAKVDDIVAGYAEAASQGKSAQYMSDLAQNKDQLPYDTWAKATKEVLALDAVEQKLKIQERAESFQTVSNGINNNTITTVEDFNQYPGLTGLDQLKLQGQLEKHQQALAKSRYNIVQAQRNISQGNPGLNTDAQKNTMFANARAEFEEQAKRPMTVFDMWDSIKGTGPIPTSGIANTSMGANVSQFDNQLTAMLTSNDPVQVAQASMIYNDAVHVMKQPNMINLSGPALSIASNFNSQNLGSIDQQELAQRVSDATLNAKDPEIAERADRFRKEYVSNKKQPNLMKSLFKETFNTSYTPGVSDSAMGVFKETFRENFLRTGNGDAALKATKYEMRNWGTSKWFEDGQVGQPVPEKELAIASIGYAFDNQLRVTTQLYINQNRILRGMNEDLPANRRDNSLPTVEWVNPGQEINLDNISEKDRVFKALGQESGVTSYFTNQSKPAVKVNGLETDLFLMPTPESKLGERVQYALYYHDKFGQAQPLPDTSSPTGVAMFSPVGMEKWAPSVLEDETSEQVKAAAVDFQKKQARQEWDDLHPGGVIGRMIEENTSGLIFGIQERGTEEQRAEIWRKMNSGDAPELEKLIRQKIQGDNVSTVVSKAKEADHVGVAPSAAEKLDAVIEEKQNEAAPAKSVTESVADKLVSSEGEGSNIKGDVKTGKFGLTQAALDDMGVKTKLEDLTESQAKRLVKQFSGKQQNQIAKEIPGFANAPFEIREAYAHAAFNIGASRFIDKVKAAASKGDWLGGMKAALAVSTQDGKTMRGIGKRRAEEYNAVAKVLNEPLIQFVEQTRTSLNFLGKDNSIIFSLTKPRHAQSGLGKIPVPELGSGK